MPRVHKPRSGSLQFWPRKRARRQYPRIRSWAEVDTAKLLGFMGYKVGMTHLEISENNPNIRGERVKVVPATLVECPPIKPFSLRFYKKTPYGLQPFSDLLSKNTTKELQKKLKLPKSKSKTSKLPEEFHEVRLVAYTQPKLTSLPKKKPEIMEIKISKNDLEFAKSLLEKDININDLFEEGSFIDIHAVSKGRGTQGPVKRFGISLKSHKSEKGRRRPGSLGSWKAANTMWTVSQAGQTGYHTRTELNKKILKICQPDEITPKSGGFPNYGKVRNTCILLKGSIPGPRKRLIRFTHPMRKSPKHPFEVKYIHKK